MSHTGEWAALATAVIWSFSSMVFTAATRRVGSGPVNYVRLLLAALLLLTTVVVVSGSMQATGNQWLWLTLSGLTGLVFGDSYLFRAFQMIGARLSMLIMSSSPALAAMIAYVALGQTMLWAAVAGMVVTTAGIALVVFQRHDDDLSRPNAMGVLYALLGSIGQAVGLVCAGMAFDLGTIDSVFAVLIRIASSAFIMTVFFGLTGKLAGHFRSLIRDRRALTLTGLGAFLGPYLGITLSLVAIRYTPIGIASTIMATVPVVMLPLVVLIHKERLTWKAIVGALAAVGGVALLFME